MIIIVGAAIGFVLGLAGRPWWWVLLAQLAVLAVLLAADGVPPLSRASDLIELVGWRFVRLALPALIAWAFGSFLFRIVRRMRRGPA